ncbi:MAG TPA: DUF6295 family protein [Acidimicrobiales bacterium]|nr:DUF6295 family protein [Acidimicrobiales bacterium]
MCTDIAKSIDLIGSGKGPQGWYPLAKAVVSYDHPFHAPLDHAINVDFLDSAEGLNGRASIELTMDGARQLAQTILAAVDQAERLHGHSAP